MRINMLTLADIRNTEPCYDPVKYLPENWTGTVIDILSVSACPPEDRLSVVLKFLPLNSSVMRLFAVACAREAMRVTGWADPRSVAACDVAERFANGLASDEELRIAADAAYAAYVAASASASASTSTSAAYAAYVATYAAYVATSASYVAASAVYAAYAVASAATVKRKHRIWQIETLKNLIVEHADRPTRGETK